MGKKHIFGIGLNKTGTTSLKRAFVELGFRHFDRRPMATRLFFKNKFSQIFDLIEDYDSFEDWPWPLMVPQLLDRYGDDALFVLTRRRSADIWVESLKSNSLKTHPVNNPRQKIFGHAYPHGAEAEHAAFYDNHLASVRSLFPANSPQLCELCWEDGDGWPELCAFLGMDPPRSPFPHANQSVGAQIDPDRLAENQARIAEQIKNLKK